MLHRLYRLSAPRARSARWFPVANLVLDAILLRAIWMCLTGRVTWRGTVYGPAVAAAQPVSKPVSHV